MSTNSVTNSPPSPSHSPSPSSDDLDIGAGPSVPSHPRAAVPPAAPAVVAAAAITFICCICNLGFDSEKSLSGHMRMHPDRPWRGMYPLPTFSRDDFADVIELLNDPEEEEEVENVAAGDGEATTAGGGEGEFGGRRWILPDLNKTP
ncbi:zinc finger protein ZAT2-like [Impatiens glandulifera]|uniref:zinc finger protein ZAT2-like n=1 Tax=Impatiens glandulifera TaxID=253017 RepID=UPI001FB1347F|nr:zinc finger protein ZAT2-like [Impatiens glandulifera]